MKKGRKPIFKPQSREHRRLAQCHLLFAKSSNCPVLNKTVDQVKLTAIKGVAPSYGIFAGIAVGNYTNPAADNSAKEAVAPISNIPNIKDRSIPHFLILGTADPVIKNQAVSEYMNALVKAGQRVEYVQVGGASHAFFDWKPDQATKDIFAKYGVYYCNEMELFFNSIFYK
jgi:acetyl esterase